MNLEKRLEWFFDRKLIMLFLCEGRFLNPLIPDEMSRIKKSGLLDDDLTLLVLEKKITKCISHLPRGMYFPVAISKVLKNGENFSEELAIQFHYDFIKIDQYQKWYLRENKIAGKILSLFERNLYYEKDIKLYFVEYWSEKRWDKCYLDSEITPMRALGIEMVKEEFKLKLNNQKDDSLDPSSFRIDKKERCFVLSKNYGEVMLTDAPRFWLLNHLDDSGSHLVFGKRYLPLSYSE